MHDETFRFAARMMLAALLVIASGAAGCWTHSDPFEACFAWPAPEACPSEDVAILYLGATFSGCDRAASIDAGMRKDDKCCYEVTSEHDIRCDFGH
ncbi:MAG: hypothetical protein QM820_62120 [Minicystis sp.]